MPVADNTSEAGKAQNRRVTVEATFEIPNSLPEPVNAAPAPQTTKVAQHCVPQTPTTVASSDSVVRQAQPITETLTDKVSEIRFASGKSDIPNAAIDTLRRRINALSEKENLRVRFIGHTDNERLSARTAAILSLIHI